MLRTLRIAAVVAGGTGAAPLVTDVGGIALGAVLGARGFPELQLLNPVYLLVGRYYAGALQVTPERNGYTVRHGVYAVLAQPHGPVALHGVQVFYDLHRVAAFLQVLGKQYAYQ